jgi:hypothetical protein
MEETEKKPEPLGCIGCACKHSEILEHILDDMLMSEAITDSEDEQYLINERKRLRHFRKQWEDWLMEPEKIGVQSFDLCPTCGLRGVLP